MPNTNVYTGLDGAISVAVESGPEGDAAGTVADTYALSPIGRATGVSIQVHSDLRPFHEIGQRYASELRPGNVNITGTIDRAYINGALLKLMLGEGAEPSRPAGAFISPSFNLSLRHENQAFPGNAATITLHGVKLNTWNYTMPEDDFVLEQVAFKALWISVEDTTA
ncbi:MAG: hypothetical protein ACOX5Z_02460 [Desulfobulbus sp.]|jgi:hypothetical protein